jgi:PQQ enzyme repeat
LVELPIGDIQRIVGKLAVNHRNPSLRAFVAGCALAALHFVLPSNAAVNVTQHHNHATRDGLYIDPAFTQSAAAALKRDLNFDGTISGDVHAQPLYIEGGPGGRAMVIAVTESDNVYALDAADGSVIWERNVGAPVPLSDLPCGDIDPLGITGTPVVDLATRTLYLDAMTTPDGGTTKEHLLYALDVDTGTTNSGWPVNVNAAASYHGTAFTSDSQNERGALAFLGGYVYAPYGGHAGDCSIYYGWIVGVQADNPANVLAWATPARGGGAWSVGGVAGDGVNPFIATGNTFGAATWSGGESIIRFQPGPIFSGLTNDYWAPTNWMALDGGDVDIGGSGPLIVDVPGATPSQLVVSLGKDGNAYLLNRTNLGGVSPPLDQKLISSSQIIQAAATYRTALGTYVVCNSGGDQLIAFRITPTSPPAISGVWTNSEGGRGSPFVTSTDGSNNVVVWGIGSEGDQRLHGFDGDTGAVIFNGGGANELMSGTQRFNTAIAARGRIYVANNNQVYAFTLPVPPIVLTNAMALPGGGFQFGFTNTPGLSFTAYGTSNLSAPIANWTRLGGVTETSPGQFEFTDTTPSADNEHFYRVTSP